MGSADLQSRWALLVEDEVLVAMATEDSLRAMGFEPIMAATGGEALSAIAQHVDSLSCAMIDVGLPDISGDDLARRLRALSASLPIILASGYDSAELRQGFLNDARVRVLPKPYSDRQLRSALADLDLTLTAT